MRSRGEPPRADRSQWFPLQLVRGVIAVFSLAGWPVLAQTPPYSPFAALSVVDPCGGQSAFVGSTMIVEESHGACQPQAISDVSGKVLSPLVVSLTSATTGIAAGDIVYISGVTGGINANGTSIVSSATGSSLTLKTASNGGSYSAGGQLSAQFLKSGMAPDRYDLKVLTQTGSSWASPPTIVDLTDSAARTNLGIGVCSVGNPDGYTDGTSTYITFLVQDPTGTNCSSSSTPSGGQYYDLWACNLSAGVTEANMTLGNCAQLLTSTQTAMQPGAFLDPHIWHNKHIYTSERCYVWSAYTCASQGYAFWTLDDVPVTWSNPPRITTGSTVVRYTFSTLGKWAPGSPQVTDGCEQFFKLTSLGDLPGGSVVRGFFNANQVGNSYGTVHGSNPCDQLGANTFPYDGVFYGDFTATSSVSQPAVGANFTQLYPPYDSTNPSYPYTANCVTPGGHIQCYSEFPYVFHDMRRMVFSGSLFTQSWVIYTCAADSALGCQPNFNDDEIQALLSADVTSSAYPMSIIGMAARTNYNVLASPMCQAFLSPSPSPQCGIAYGYFGGCSHFSVDEPTQTLTCAAVTNVRDVNNIPESQTVVTPLASTQGAPFLSILYPGVVVRGNVQTAGGIILSSKPTP
jgi:hypothetical protein